MSAPGEAAPLRTVIIDDTPDLRTLLTIALSGHGFDVVGEAADGRAGIDLVGAQHPDLILLDLAMPVMDGLEALPKIRTLCPDATIVVLSGFGADQMSRQALGAGADGYVQKGTSLAKILGYLDSITSGQRVPTSIGLEPRGGRSSEPVAPRPPSPAPAALDQAPFGVLRLDDSQPVNVSFANPTAQRLLHDPLHPGTALELVAPSLAAAVTAHRLDVDSTFQVDIDGTAVRVSMRRDHRSTYLYLVPGSDTDGLLRLAIATTAHELRGPVSVISGVAEMVGELGPDMDAAQRGRLLESVARQARMLDGLTADLLTAAQIEGGTLRVDLETVDPRAIVTDLLIDRSDVHVEALGECRVEADPLRLAQMIENLLANARKYAEPPYAIRINPHEDRVRIEVHDRGDGIPEDFRPHLFKEFSRAAGMTARGTGLGLYIVRSLAEAQHGSAEYAPGLEGGSIFSVVLRRR